MEIRERIFNNDIIFGTAIEKKEIEYCNGKPKFRTKAEIIEYIGRRNKLKGGKGFKYYKCAECGCWHLTTHTPFGDYMLQKHSKKYNRLEKKMADSKIYRHYGIAN